MSDTTSATSEKQINPLLDFSDLPRFGEIHPEHVTPALDVLLADASAAVERATRAGYARRRGTISSSRSRRATERLSRAWGVVGHLNAVADTPELRAAYGENLPRVTEFWSSVGQNLALYEKYKALAASDDFAALTGERKKILEQCAARLPSVGRRTARRPQAALRANCRNDRRSCRRRSRDHVLDATNAFAYIVDETKANSPACPKT